jgi:hypothetical protein
MAYAIYSKKQNKELAERHGTGELDGVSRISVKAYGSRDAAAGPSSRMLDFLKRKKLKIKRFTSKTA